MLRIQNIILEMVARHEDLTVTAHRLCLELEKAAPGIVCSFLLVDTGGVLHPLAAPGLPLAYSEGLNGIVAGPNVGSCGSAAFFGRSVAVKDIETDPRWVDFRSLPLSLGLKACWSNPVKDSSGRTIAVFAIYFREKRVPTAFEKRIVRASLTLCAIAIQHHNWQVDQERRAVTDGLTNLLNRAGFHNALADLERGAIASWALVIVDLDNLKTINDTFGHPAGDALIVATAKRLVAILPTSDVFRVGGDEFAIIVRDRPTIAKLAERIEEVLRGLREPLPLVDHVIVPHATAGGAVCNVATRTTGDVLRCADFALYHAKETRRGGFVEYLPGIGTRITKRLRSIRNVDAALREGRVDAFYQPIVRLDTREIIGLEALARIRHGGRIQAAFEFQEATSDAQIAAELTDQMAALVAADIQRWISLEIPFGSVSINAASADFRGGRLCERLTSTFAAHGVPLNHLVLEVTEEVYLGQDDPLIGDCLRRLRAKGIRIALDDFGTGFASLTHLMNVPVDIIKIDKSFIKRLTPETSAHVITRGLVHIAKGLRLKVVAEGIEDEAQATELANIGCACGQGYLFARPMDRTAMTELLRAASRRQAPDVQSWNGSPTRRVSGVA